MGESLSTRKQRILHAVVSDYITTAEPVGSEWLATRHDFGCRSATLRSEMGEMVDEGYLVQPHTSAGRIPTTVGYRYYVDRLMTPMPPDRPQRLAARRRLAKAAEDVRNTIRDACRLLAELTQYPSVASAPTNGDVVLHRLYLAPAGAHHVLLVLLLSTGHVENRVVELTRSLTDATLSALIHRLNGRFAGRSVQDLANQARVEPRPGSDGDEVRRICSAVSQAAAAFSDQHLFFEGAGYMLRQREFRDVLRLEQLLTALMDHRALIHAFGGVSAEDGVTVLIGPENRVDAMEDCSLVTKRYRAGSDGWGYIGVVGPTRMDYDRAVAAVDLMAAGLSAALARVSPISDSGLCRVYPEG